MTSCLTFLVDGAGYTHTIVIKDAVPHRRRTYYKDPTGNEWEFVQVQCKATNTPLAFQVTVLASVLVSQPRGTKRRLLVTIRVGVQCVIQCRYSTYVHTRVPNGELFDICARDPHTVSIKMSTGRQALVFGAGAAAGFGLHWLLRAASKNNQPAIAGSPEQRVTQPHRQPRERAAPREQKHPFPGFKHGAALPLNPEQSVEQQAALILEVKSTCSC